MPTKKNLEGKLIKSELNLRELTIRMEKLDREYESVLGQSGLSFEQIQNYIENPDNFSQPIWQRMELEKKKLSEKLDLALQSIKDPSKLKKTFDERRSIQPHWIFVR